MVGGSLLRARACAGRLFLVLALVATVAGVVLAPEKASAQAVPDPLVGLQIDEARAAGRTDEALRLIDGALATADDPHFVEDLLARKAAILSEAGRHAEAADALEAGNYRPLLGTFQVVEGRVANAAIKSGRAYINFGADPKTDFTVTIAPEDRKAFRARGIDPRLLTGQRIRVRGILDRYNGPEIVIANPDMIEMLGPLPPPQVATKKKKARTDPGSF